jgi:hypothetical protein
MVLVASNHAVQVVVTKPIAVLVRRLLATVGGTIIVKHMTTGLSWTTIFQTCQLEDHALEAVQMDRLRLQLILREWLPLLPVFQNISY